MKSSFFEDEVMPIYQRGNFTDGESWGRFRFRTP